jgi:hypothetical protein
VFEYVGPHSVKSIFDDLESTERTNLILHVCLAISHIQTTIAWTHYDLHAQNIMVQISQPKRFTYNSYGTARSILSRYDIKFIDFDSSHIAGMTPKWIALSNVAVECGIVPQVFDDFADYANVVTWYMRFCRTYNPTIIAAITNNGFVPYDCTKSLSASQEEYEGYEDMDGHYPNACIHRVYWCDQTLEPANDSIKNECNQIGRDKQNRIEARPMNGKTFFELVLAQFDIYGLIGV